MPIEIRELIIRTEISSQARNNGSAVKEKQLEKLRSRLLDECRQMLNTGKRNLSRR